MSSGAGTRVAVALEREDLAVVDEAVDHRGGGGGHGRGDQGWADFVGRRVEVFGDRFGDQLLGARGAGASAKAQLLPARVCAVAARAAPTRRRAGCLLCCRGRQRSCALRSVRHRRCRRASCGRSRARRTTGAPRSRSSRGVRCFLRSLSLRGGDLPSPSSGRGRTLGCGLPPHGWPARRSPPPLP
jgi:hypothetical protein